MKKTLTALAATFSLATGCLAVPANDHFADATLIEGFPACVVQGDTSEATLEPGEPVIGANGIGAGSVWFSWTAGENRFVEFTLEGSSSDLVTPGDGRGSSGSSSSSYSGNPGIPRFGLAVFTGNSVNDLTLVPDAEIALVRGDTLQLVFRSAVDVAAGTTYHIGVRMDAELATSPFLALSVKPASNPVNDHFASSTVIPFDRISSRVSFRTAWATEEQAPVDNPGDARGRSVWYSWTPATSGTYKARLDTLDPSTFSFYVGDRLIGGLERVVSGGADRITSSLDAPEADIEASAGTTYRIHVNVFETVFPTSPQFPALAEGGVVITRVPDTSENDSFADRITLPSAVPQSFASGGGTATREVGEPDHAPFSGGSSWHSFTPEETGIYEFAGRGSALQVYTGSGVGALSRVAPIEQVPRVGFSYLSLTAGIAYQIAHLGAEPIAYTISGPALSRSPGDTSVSSVSLGTTDSATTRVFHLGGGGSLNPSTWMWKPSSTGTATIDASEFPVATQLSVFRSGEERAYANVTALDAILKFPVTAGESFTITAYPAKNDGILADLFYEGFLGFDLSVAPLGATGAADILPTDIQVSLAVGSITVAWTPHPAAPAGTLYQVQQASGLSGFTAVGGAPTTATSATFAAGNAPMMFFRIQTSLP